MFSNIAKFWMVAFLISSIAVSPLRAEDEIEIPEPTNITVETRDGVSLRCTWYAGTLKKKSVPIILMHGWEGVRGELDGIARQLQAKGHAVIAPDFRGHGESKTVMVGGEAKPIDLEKDAKPVLLSMKYDFRAVKKFLLEKNDRGELNIEMLCVIASDINCIPAMNWAVYDWSLPQFVNGTKQGRDVKALILLSPERSYKRVTTSDAEKHPLFSGYKSDFVLSVMILAGDRNRSSEANAEKLYENLSKTRPKLDPELTGEALHKKKDLYFITRPVELQGSNLLDPRNKLSLDRQVLGFIKFRLEMRDDVFAWAKRSRE